MKITITGASDDLIEIGGDISEEFDGCDGSALLCCGDGSVLRIVYDDDGIWRVTRIIAGTASYTLVCGDVIADTCDVATMEGDLKFVGCASQVATTDKTFQAGRRLRSR